MIRYILSSLLHAKGLLSGSVLGVYLQNFLPVLICLGLVIMQHIVITQITVSLYQASLIRVFGSRLSLDKLYELLVMRLGGTCLGFRVEFVTDMGTLIALSASA